MILEKALLGLLITFNLRNNFIHQQNLEYGNKNDHKTLNHDFY